MNVQEFEYIKSIVHERTSILIDINDVNLVELRLAPLVEKEGFRSVEQLIEHLRRNFNSNDLQKRVVEVLLNNETSFFRDVTLFDALRDCVLPELVQRKRRSDDNLLIWSAACSTGQEPYSLAMLLLDCFPFQVFNGTIKVVASDISSSSLAYARAGRYSLLEINRGLPADYLIKYFHQEGGHLRIDDRIRNMIEFHQVNLVEPWPPFWSSMDIILMRNVLIYVSLEVKKAILDKVKRCLSRDGYFILGSAETTINIDDSFEPVYYKDCVCYRLRSLYC